MHIQVQFWAKIISSLITAASEVKFSKLAAVFFSSQLLNSSILKKRDHISNVTFLNGLNKFLIRCRFFKRTDFQRWVWIAFVFLAESVFPAKSRCPAFTFYFTFICILCLLSKYLWEPCQILLKPHPLDVPAEPSPLSTLAVCSGAQLEMQVNKFWGLLLFGVGKDPEGKTHAGNLSTPARRGCPGKRGQQPLWRQDFFFQPPSATDGPQGQTQPVLFGAYLETARPRRAEVLSPLGQAAWVGSCRQSCPPSRGCAGCHGGRAVRRSPTMLAARGVTRGRSRAPKLGIAGSPGVLPLGVLCVGVTAGNLQSSPGTESLRSYLFNVRCASENPDVISNWNLPFEKHIERDMSFYILFYLLIKFSCTRASG